MICSPLPVPFKIIAAINTIAYNNILYCENEINNSGIIVSTIAAIIEPFKLPIPPSTTITRISTDLLKSNPLGG